ncbi:Hypothetical_protein [Hexamita inflata]|uniref:Hypothetical_protein n=1 Tax=Hexamita inflata TaxID=28002 RepID=A0AA86P0S2_9EUKA|nr:Hypothetical protein HINF_LOCUS15954 [Hexamita inflata]
MPATRPVFVSFHRSKIKQASRKNIENTPSDNYVTHIQRIRLQLRISSFGPLCSWEHEFISLLAGSQPDHRRGARHDPLSGTQPWHCASRRCELAGKYYRVLDERLRRPRPKARWIAGLSLQHTLRRYTQMRREAETFTWSSPEKTAWSFPLFWNQLAKSAVVCSASVNLEPALKQRQCTRTPANSTAAAHHYAYSCRSSGVCRSWRQRAVNRVCAGSGVRRAVSDKQGACTPVLLPLQASPESNPFRRFGTCRGLIDLVNANATAATAGVAWIKTRATQLVQTPLSEQRELNSQRQRARYSTTVYNELGEHAEPCVSRLGLAPDSFAFPGKHGDARPQRPVFAVSTDQKIKQVSRKILKIFVGPLCNSHPVHPITAAIQHNWPTLQLGTRIDFTFGRKLSRPQARGAA